MCIRDYQETLSNDSHLELTEIESLLSTPELAANSNDVISFDSSKGFITLDTDNKFSTDSLNKENFYNLLVKLNENDKLELNDSLLTSQFYLTPDELNSLLKPNDAGNLTNDLNNKETLDGGKKLDCSELSPETTFSSIKIDNSQCQEICCLLKIDYFDFNFGEN